MTPEAEQQLKDKQWLVDQHVVQLISIVELAKRLAVTPGTVSRRLKAHGIVSPSQQQLREASNLRKYGVKNSGQVHGSRERAKKTMEDKYGGHVWSTPNRHVRDATCLAKYGDANVGRTNYAKQKAKRTNNERYGCDHERGSHISKEIRDILTNRDWLVDQHHAQQRSILSISDQLGVSTSTVVTSMDKLSIEVVAWYHKVPPDVHAKLTDTEWMIHQNVDLIKSGTQIAKELNVDPWTVQRRFTEAGIDIKLHNSSAGEREVRQFIKEINVESVHNDRCLISPKEVDLYIPAHNLAIEYCGVYWHSEGSGKDRRYHQAKQQKCAELGIQLLTIYDCAIPSR